MNELVSTNNNFSLDFSNFSKTSRSTWLEKIKHDLKLQSLEKFDKSFEDYFSITPFADEDFLQSNNIQPIVLPSIDKNYLIAEYISISTENIPQSNKGLLNALMRGVQTPVFFLLEKFTPEQFSALFNEVACEYIFTHFYAVKPEFSLIEGNLKSFALSQKINNKSILKKFEGATNITYNVFSEMSVEQHEILLNEISESLPHFYFFCIDATFQTSETKNVVEQIAQLSLQLIEFFKSAEKNRLSLNTIAEKMRVRIAVGTKYYTEIAKLRAIKIVIANVMKQWGIKPLAIPIDVVVYPTPTEKNSHSDKISATVQILAAYLGGANTVLTLNNSNENSVGFNSRILTNIQHVLQLESGIPQINDAISGSYYIEQLTTRLVEAAWKIILRQQI